MTYDSLYMNTIQRNMRGLFSMLLDESQDYCLGVTAFMKSQVRQQIDEGNWLAINKTALQLYELAEMDSLPYSSNLGIDRYISDWIADIYALLQFESGIPSYELVEFCPVEELIKRYGSLHETSVSNACNILLNLFVS